MTTMPTQTYHLFIRATPRRIWDAITKPEFTAGYLYGALVETTGQIGSPFRYHSPDRSALWGDETVLAAQPPHLLVVGYRALYDPDLKIEEPSRVTWRIQQDQQDHQDQPDQDHVSLLTIVHDHLGGAPKTAERVAGPGWMRVLSGLKTLLETGRPMNAA
jgi:uncharacterized protein YndB with AHSA1/START domain